MESLQQGWDATVDGVISSADYYFNASRTAAGSSEGSRLEWRHDAYTYSCNWAGRYTSRSRTGAMNSGVPVHRCQFNCLRVLLHFKSRWNLNVSLYVVSVHDWLAGGLVVSGDWLVWPTQLTSRYDSNAPWAPEANKFERKSFRPQIAFGLELKKKKKKLF